MSALSHETRWLETYSGGYLHIVGKNDFKPLCKARYAIRADECFNVGGAKVSDTYSANYCRKCVTNLLVLTTKDVS